MYAAGKIISPKLDHESRFFFLMTTFVHGTSTKLRAKFHGTQCANPQHNEFEGNHGSFVMHWKTEFVFVSSETTFDRKHVHACTSVLYILMSCTWLCMHMHAYSRVCLFTCRRMLCDACSRSTGLCCKCCVPYVSNKQAFPLLHASKGGLAIWEDWLFRITFLSKFTTICEFGYWASNFLQMMEWRRVIREWAKEAWRKGLLTIA